MWGRGYLPSSHIFPLKNGKKFALNWGTTVNVVDGGAHGKLFLRDAKNTKRPCSPLASWSPSVGS